MFFSSAAPSPQRQPLLHTTSPPKKSTSSKIRNLLFHTDGDATGSSDRIETKHVNDAVAPVAFAPPLPSAKSNPRDTFQRANSHPIRLDASAALSATRSFDPSMSRAAALDGISTSSCQQAQAPPSLRSTVYGSCSHVLSTVIKMLFQTVKTHNQIIDPTVTLIDHQVDSSNTVRKAKLLYIALLEKAQKERGEWQGFSATEDHTDQETPHESAYDVLANNLKDSTTYESFAVLHELLELSFRNLRVALVSPTVYANHKSDLMKEPLECPASLNTLLRVGEFLSELNRDEKNCLLRLLNLWYALCVVDPDRQQLKLIVEQRHTLVLSEASEMEFMQHAARNTARSDPTAVDLLVLMTQYREILFSGLEYYKIRHEMRFTSPPSMDVNQEEIEPPFESPADDADVSSSETALLLVRETEQLRPAVETTCPSTGSCPPATQSIETQTPPVTCAEVQSTETQTCSEEQSTETQSCSDDTATEIMKLPPLPNQTLQDELTSSQLEVSTPQPCKITNTIPVVNAVRHRRTIKSPRTVRPTTASPRRKRVVHQVAVHQRQAAARQEAEERRLRDLTVTCVGLSVVVATVGAVVTMLLAQRKQQH